MKKQRINKTTASRQWVIAAIGANILLSVFFYLSLLINADHQNTSAAKIYEQSISASISQYEYLPALLATDTLFINTLLYPSDNRLLVNKKLSFIAERAGAEVAYLMNLSGTVVATSNFNSADSFLDKNYAFRPYFQKALDDKKRQFYYAKGATTGIPGFFISEPIIYNGQTIGAAVVKLTMAYWEGNWREAKNTVITVDNNNVIILSSTDQWRYKTIGELSNDTLARIKKLQQFGDKQHSSLYDKIYTLNFSNYINLTFWRIDGELYLTQKSTIPEVNWSFYYLVKHDQFLYPTIIFFTVTSLFLFFFYIIRRERRHKIASINKNRKLELIRQEELKTVMDNIHVGVVLFSDNGSLVSINDHAKYLLFTGHLPHPEKAIFINDIINIDINQLDKLLLNDIASVSYHEAYALESGKETTPLMFALSKVSAMDTSLYLMTFINIKRRKAAEDELVKINNSLEDTIAQRTEELHKAQATLIQKNKAAALGNMAATIVHELSQPLSAINSSISAVSAKIKNNDWIGAEESANRLNPLSKKMYNVINLLKYFSYKDNESEHKTSLIDVVMSSLNNVKDIIHEKKILLDDEIVNRIGLTEKIYVDINPLKLDLVLSNIIKNAIDAAEKSSHAKITVNIEIAKKNVLIHITDNGGGIDENIMSKLFSPYFTTKEVGKGLGLGLSISHEIIQDYNGDIHARNVEDGVCFTIQLPLHADSNHTIETV